jgi:phosphopantetheinyl transferase
MQTPTDTAEPTSSSITGLFGRSAPQWYAAREISPLRAARILAGRLVVRDLVRQRQAGHWAGFEPTRPGQKPVMTESETDFSISHSGQWMLAAIVERGHVGVDIEIHRSQFDHPGLTRRMCTAAEHEMIRELEPERRRAWLARLWTAKEAVSKLDGSGLRKDFRQMHLGDRLPIDDAEHPIAASIASSEQFDPSRFVLLRPQIGRGTTPMTEVAS